MANPRGNPRQDARGQRTGRYVRTLDAAERDARVAELVAEGWSQRAIAAEVGYSHHSSVAEAHRRAVRSVLQGPAEKLLALHMNRLEFMFASLMEMAEDTYITVSHGKIIRDEEGNPVPDIGPKLAAFREARASLESFRRLVGLDEAVKVDATVHQVTQQDIALQELLAEMRAKNAATVDELRVDREPER
jgi:hypothetical protein